MPPRRTMRGTAARTAACACVVFLLTAVGTVTHAAADGADAATASTTDGGAATAAFAPIRSTPPVSTADAAHDVPAAAFSSSRTASCSCAPLLSTRVLVLGHGAPRDSPFWSFVHRGSVDAGKRVRATVDARFVSTEQLQQQYGGSAALGMVSLLDESIAQFQSSSVWPHVLVVSIVAATRMAARVAVFKARGVIIFTYNGDESDARVCWARSSTSRPTSAWPARKPD